MFIFTLPTNPLQDHTIRSHRQRLRKTGAIAKEVNNKKPPHFCCRHIWSNPPHHRSYHSTFLTSLSWPFCSLCSSYLKRAWVPMQADWLGWSTSDDDKWKYLTSYNVIFSLHVRSKYTDIHPNFKLILYLSFHIISFPRHHSKYRENSRPCWRKVSRPI